jgi:hypothetical protein
MSLPISQHHQRRGEQERDHHRVRHSAPADPDAERPKQVERKTHQRSHTRGDTDDDQIEGDSADRPEERRHEACDPEVLSPGQWEGPRSDEAEDRGLDGRKDSVELASYVRLPRWLLVGVGIVVLACEERSVQLPRGDGRIRDRVCP